MESVAFFIQDKLDVSSGLAASALHKYFKDLLDEYKKHLKSEIEKLRKEKKQLRKEKKQSKKEKGEDQDEEQTPNQNGIARSTNLDVNVEMYGSLNQSNPVYEPSDPAALEEGRAGLPSPGSNATSPASSTKADPGCREDICQKIKDLESKMANPRLSLEGAGTGDRDKNWSSHYKGTKQLEDAWNDYVNSQDDHKAVVEDVNDYEFDLASAIIYFDGETTKTNSKRKSGLFENFLELKNAEEHSKYLEELSKVRESLDEMHDKASSLDDKNGKKIWKDGKAGSVENLAHGLIENRKFQDYCIFKWGVKLMCCGCFGLIELKDGPKDRRFASCRSTVKFRVALWNCVIAIAQLAYIILVYQNS